MSEFLKPCPFCDSEVEHITVANVLNGWHSVTCPLCGASVEEKTFDNVKEKWNRRVDPARVEPAKPEPTEGERLAEKYINTTGIISLCSTDGYHITIPDCGKQYLLLIVSKIIDDVLKNRPSPAAIDDAVKAERERCKKCIRESMSPNGAIGEIDGIKEGW